MLGCEECRCIATGKARGGLGYTAPDSDDEGGVIVAFYCPVCAARENFAPLPKSFTRVFDEPAVRRAD